jgi:hypothetical protein
MSGPLIRLVFRPMLVENTNDPSASVKGCLREGLAVAMLREPVASIDLYLVARGQAAHAFRHEFADALKEAATRLAG